MLQELLVMENADEPRAWATRGVTEAAAAPKNSMPLTTIDKQFKPVHRHDAARSTALLRYTFAWRISALGGEAGAR